MSFEKKILFIAYYFPPLGSIGAKRTIRYIRNLRSLGWKSYVITPRKWTYSEVEAFWDNSDTAEMSKYAEIYRTNYIDITKINKYLSKVPYLRRYSPDLNRLLYYFPPEHCLGWLPFVFFKAKEIIKKRGISVVYSTSAPYLAHIIGYLLKKSTGTLWIADLRDEWSLHPYRKPLFEWQRMVDGKLEKKVLSEADSIVTVSKLYKQQFQTILKDYNKKINVITNGYHKEDFINVPHTNRSNRMTITYCGLFYGTRSPESFIKAVNELICEGILDAGKIQVNFVGPKKPNRWQRLTYRISQQVFNWTGFVSHKTAIKYLMNSDLLLYISSGRGRGNIQGKTFEYIATGKPVFIIADNFDEGSEIIEKSQTKVAFVKPNNHGMLKTTLAQLYYRWLSADLSVKPNWEVIQKYEDVQLTQKLSYIIEESAINKASAGKGFIQKK